MYLEYFVTFFFIRKKHAVKTKIAENMLICKFSSNLRVNQGIVQISSARCIVLTVHLGRDL